MALSDVLPGQVFGRRPSLGAIAPLPGRVPCSAIGALWLCQSWRHARPVSCPDPCCTRRSPAPVPPFSLTGTRRAAAGGVAVRQGGVPVRDRSRRLCRRHQLLPAPYAAFQPRKTYCSALTLRTGGATRAESIMRSCNYAVGTFLGVAIIGWFVRAAHELPAIVCAY